MKNLNRLAIILLFITAATWGLSYSAQAKAMDTMSPLMFVFLRYLLGALMLVPAILFSGNARIKSLFTVESSVGYALPAVKYCNNSVCCIHLPEKPVS